MKNQKQQQSPPPQQKQEEEVYHFDDELTNEHIHAIQNDDIEKVIEIQERTKNSKKKINIQKVYNTCGVDAVSKMSDKINDQASYEILKTVDHIIGDKLIRLKSNKEINFRLKELIKTVFETIMFQYLKGENENTVEFKKQEFLKKLFISICRLDENKYYEYTYIFYVFQYLFENFKCCIENELYDDKIYKRAYDIACKNEFKEMITYLIEFKQKLDN